MLGYAIAEVAGIALEDSSSTGCKVTILDAQNLLSSVTGSTQNAADGTLHTQILSTTKGRAFGLKIDFIPPDVLNSIIAAVGAAVAAGNPFNVTVEDDLTSFDGDVVPDFQAGWLKVAPQRTHPDVVKDVEMRFLTAE